MTVVTSMDEFDDELRHHFYSKKIYIEGDSWVSHPLITDIGDHIDRLAPDDHLILNVAWHGDEARDIFDPRGAQFADMRSVLTSERWGDRFDLTFISAAGNDIIGPDILEHAYVRDKRQHPKLYGRELLADNYFDVVSDVVSGYERFLRMVRSSQLNARTPIITHAYSYLQPREAGTRFGPIKFGKGWIARYLKQLGVRDEHEQYDIVVEMLDAFYGRLATLNGKFDRFMAVDTRRLLLKRDGTPDLRYWRDEVHPNDAGYRQLTRTIRERASDRGLWTL